MTIFTSTLTVTSWYNENFNGFENNYRINKISYLDIDTNESADGVLIAGNTRVSLEIEGSADFPMSTDFAFVPKFMIIPKEENYVNNQQSVETNFMIRRFRIADGSGLTISGTKALMSFDLSFTDAEQLLLDETSEYRIVVAVGDTQYQSKDSERVTLIADERTFDVSSDVQGLTGEATIEIYKYNA